MQEGPRVEKCPIAIQFLGKYVIVMGVSNLIAEIITDVKLAYGPVHHGYIKNHIFWSSGQNYWSRLLKRVYILTAFQSIFIALYYVICGLVKLPIHLFILQANDRGMMSFRFSWYILTQVMINSFLFELQEIDIISQGILLIICWETYFKLIISLGTYKNNFVV